MPNFGFVFGKNLQQLRLAAGARPAMASSPMWLVILGAGFLSNAGYCVYLLQSHQAGTFYYRAEYRQILTGGSIMCAVWFSGIAIYGVGVAAALGSLGAIVGWPVFMVIIIMTASVWGALTGEWRVASRVSYAYS